MAERVTFLARFRHAYVRSVGAELGISDLQNVALREAVALIEFAQSLASASVAAGKQPPK